MKIIITIKSITLLILMALVGCASPYISPQQMSTVESTPGDELGTTADSSVGGGAPYALTGGGGL